MEVWREWDTRREGGGGKEGGQEDGGWRSSLRIPTPQGLLLPTATLRAGGFTRALFPADTPPPADLKWRYMWRVGQRPSVTQFPELNAEPVVPQVGRGGPRQLVVGWLVG